MSTLKEDIRYACSKNFHFEWDLSRRTVFAVGPGADFNALVKVHFNEVLDAERLGQAIL